MKTPVAFIVFNRPDLTARVFERIREARPSKLYVAADGPRSDMVGEEQICEQVREIAAAVDWACEVKTLFRDANYGCKLAVSSALDWVFSECEEAIVVEDDCLPGPSFFFFCEDLLERYRDDTRVMHVAGYNHFPERNHEDSYFFSRYPGIWGWATWRRAWELYDRDMGEYGALRGSGRLCDMFDSASHASYWLSEFDRAYGGDVDTWDYQWVYAIRKNNGLCVRPWENLVENIGLGANATHTKDLNRERIEANRAQKIAFPLEPPAIFIPNRSKDSEFLVRHLGGDEQKKLVPNRGHRVIISRTRNALSLPGKSLRRLARSIRVEAEFWKYMSQEAVPQECQTASGEKRIERHGVSKTPIAITGMHRSGTSLLTSLLASAGLAVGENLLDGAHDNPKGYFEDVDFVDFQDHVIARSGVDLLLPGQLLFTQKDFLVAGKILRKRNRTRSTHWAWKDPRTVLFLDFWQLLAPNLRVIAVYRDPLQVVDSLLRRASDPSVQAHFANAARAWLSYNTSLLRFVRLHSATCILFSLDQIIEDFPRCCGLIERKFGLSLTPPRLDETFDRDALHRKPSRSTKVRITKAMYGQRFARLKKLLEEVAVLTQETARSD